MTESITPTPNEEKVFLVNILDPEDNPIQVAIPSYFVPNLEIGPKFAHGATSSVFSGTYQGEPCAIKITMGKLAESKWLNQFSEDDISPKLFAQFDLETAELKITSLTNQKPTLFKNLSLVVSERMEMTLSEAAFAHREFVIQNQDKIVAEMKRFQEYFYQHKLFYGDTNTDNFVIDRKPFKLRLVDFEDVWVITDQSRLDYLVDWWNKSIATFLKMVSRKPLAKQHKIFLDDTYGNFDKLYL